MAIATESPQSTIKARKGILVKRIRSNSEAAAISSPRTSSSAPVNQGDGDNGFMSKLKYNFNFFKPTNTENMDADGDNGKEGKKLSLIEARALSEYGAFLSENNNDHEAAIVTLMRALKSQTNSNGALNCDCAATLTYMGNVYMRRAEGSSGDEVMKDAKRAEFCFVQAVDVYRNNRDRKSVTRLMRRVNASKRLQNRKRRIISFGGLPNLTSVSTASNSDESDCHDKTVISDITWMENYSSEYYRKQHMIFLQQEHRPSIFNFFEGGVCSYFCVRPPVSNIEFVEKRLDL